jgi:multidrug transporter EmrE-like cation transporter
MVLLNLVFGVLWGAIGQILSFIQLQGAIKWELTPKYDIPLMLLGLPISWAFMKSVHHFVLAFNGEIYPGRILGFVVGIIVFSLMGWFLFKEGINAKTAVCLILSLAIILIQLFWKTN